MGAEGQAVGNCPACADVTFHPILDSLEVVLRRLSVVALLVVLCGFGQAQWLEKELWLPDSMSGLDWPDRIMFNPLNHHAYIGGYEAENIQIFDYTERQKAGMISDVYQVVDILLCPDRQRIVFLEAEHGRLYTLDALTDAVLRHTYICDSLACGIYNPMVHKVYIGARGQTALFVFDPGPDTLLGRIELADHVTEVAFDSATSRLFGMASEGSDHAIKVLDCVRDTLVGVLPTMAKACVDLAIDPAGRRLYCLGRSSAFNCEIWVYDMDSLAVLDTIALADTWCDDPVKLLLNPATSRLYARGMADGRRDRVAVIDSEADTIIRFIDLGDANNVLGWCLDRTDNKVYICAEGLDSVAVLGAPDSVTGWVRTGDVGWCVGWNPENDELLVPDQHNMLSVVSGANDSILVQLNYMRFLLGGPELEPDRGQALRLRVRRRGDGNRCAEQYREAPAFPHLLAGVCPGLLARREPTVCADGQFDGRAGLQWGLVPVHKADAI